MTKIMYICIIIKTGKESIGYGKVQHYRKEGERGRLQKSCEPKLMDEMKEKILNIIVMQKKYKDKDYSAKKLAEDLTPTLATSLPSSMCGFT